MQDAIPPNLTLPVAQAYALLWRRDAELGAQTAFYAEALGDPSVATNMPVGSGLVTRFTPVGVLAARRGKLRKLLVRFTGSLDPLDAGKKIRFELVVNGAPVAGSAVEILAELGGTASAQFKAAYEDGVLIQVRATPSETLHASPMHINATLI